MPYIFCILATLLLYANAYALEVPTSIQQGISLARSGEISYLRDPDGSMMIEQVIAQDQAGAFRPLATDWKPSYTKDALWIKFTLVFPAQANPEYWLEIAPSTLDQITLYTPTNEGNYQQQHLGDLSPITDRPVLHRNFIFTLPPVVSQVPLTYYMRIQSSGLVNVHATLWTPAAFVGAQNLPDSLIGAYYGIRIFLAILGLILWVWLRHKIFLLYALYQLITSLAQAYLSGSAQISWPTSPLLADHLQKSLGYLFYATVMLFYTNLLELQRHLPRLNTIIRIMTITGFTLFVGLATGSIPYSGPAIIIFSLASLLLLFYGGLRLFLAKHYEKLLYILALYIGFFSNIAFFLSMLNTFEIKLLPTAMRTDAQILWSMLSLVLVTLGLINFAKKAAEKKLKAKELALELSEENQRALDQRVQERTSQLAQSNKKLNEEIAERQALQLMLEDSLEKKKELMEAQRDFFAMTSHEFRTPLAIIDTTSQRLSLLQSQPGLDTSAMLAPALRKIRRATQRMSRVIDNFLSIDRLDAINSTHGFSQKPLDLRQLVQTTVEHYQDLSYRTIVLELSPTPAHVLGDQYLINLVISNLIDNALKYSPAETEIIARIFHGQHYCHIEIEDSGPGIDPALQHHIFEKYARVEGNTIIHGTGLGLHVARKIAERHGGQLIVNSQLNKGCCFRLTLPRHMY